MGDCDCEIARCFRAVFCTQPSFETFAALLLLLLLLST